MIETVKPPLPLWLRVSVVYLSLPPILFLFGWCRFWIALPVAICLLASLVRIFITGDLRAAWKSSKTQWAQTLTMALGAIAFAGVTGLGDWVPQSNDYLKHQLLLGDLIERPWPVRYTHNSTGLYLCYGLGHYLVPAGMAKFLGINWVGTLSFVWASLGIFLIFLGVRNSLNRFQNSGVLIFLLCSGLGACWHLFKSGLVSSYLGVQITPTNTVGFLTNVGLYTSNLDSFTRIAYQPQHAIAGWIGGLAIYELLILRSRWTESALVLALTVFWSPITALGLAVLGIVALVIQPKTFSVRPLIHLASSGLIAILLGAYFIPHLPIDEKGLIWELAASQSWYGWYILFVSFFVLLPTGAVLWLDFQRKYLVQFKPVILAMSVVLLVSPLFKFGYFGDMRMQLSGPAFLFIALGMSKGLLVGPTRSSVVPYIFLCVVFSAGALFPVLRTLDNMFSGSKTDYHISTLRKNNLFSIRDLRMPDFNVTTQYLGDGNSTAAKLILKETIRQEPP